MIHNTVIIDKSAIIEDNVEIGPYTAIGKEAVIKSGAVIGSNCFIEFAEIGHNCRISNSVSVGTPPQDLGYKDEPARAYIGDGTVLREFVSINRGSAKTLKTIIGKNCFFMACSHAAHDTRVGDNVILANGVGLGGHAAVGDNVFVGGLAGIHQFCKIGKGAMIAAGTIVSMDIIPFVMCAGYRGDLNGLNLVGMRRRKMTVSDIGAVKEAYKILFMSKLLLKDAMVEIEKIDSPYVKEIIDFIKGSTRSIARPK
ncbi:MAG: acyl-ACP--UDP-N-acetylglucosamine O-acyltransferase [Elusimicrobiota bacterium]|jgi:UDP-N-acetylglucosamine acyltransferase|nr:acyl-ACP--UDP-N-acetylglucosamine O-acyltransferase [Elusimicrobiota bacterium]